MSDEEPTEEELREAEALVQALERGSSRNALPEDALETAALLRYSRDGGALPEERRRAVLDDLLANAKPAEAAGRARSARRARWLRWLVPLAGLGAAAGAVLLMTVTAGQQEPMPSAAQESTAQESTAPRFELPPPPAELLTAQAAAAGGTAREAEALSTRMRGYRREVYAALEARYGR